MVDATNNYLTSLKKYSLWEKIQSNNFNSFHCHSRNIVILKTLCFEKTLIQLKR